MVRLVDILDNAPALDADSTTMEVSDAEDEAADQNDSRVAAPGFCVECEDQPAVIHCADCRDDFCEVCFHAQHRKGSRQKHMHAQIGGENSPAQLDAATKTALYGTSEIDTPSASAKTASALLTSMKKEADFDSDDEDDDSDMDRQMLSMHDSRSLSTMNITLSGTEAANGVVKGQVKVGEWYAERAKYIPVRLTIAERKFLRLLESALNVSEYTDKIDILSYSSKTKRQVAQIKELCSIVSGLMLASDYKAGQQLFKDRNFEQNQAFYQDIFELGRRHKIMNPEKMRNGYGKLIYMLQDSQIPEVKDMLQFSLVTPIKTVYEELEKGEALGVLHDELIVQATKEILSTREGGGTRSQIQMEIRAKERAIEILAKRYATTDISAEGIKQCLYSIGDNHAFLRTNRDPCDKMIGHLKRYFNPEKADGPFSLAISAGQGGARLSHDHKKQYNYALQSLTLWREILHDMFMLWVLAENDLLSENNPYRLRDTGQGLNRMQSAPKASRLMHAILHRAQKKVGYWVGSSVIHMGDTNVPNALLFIDKYTQIYRILLPIVRCLEAIDELADNNDGIRRYFDNEFKGTHSLKMTILSDFFRHAFDGSGADNFFSAGSCIDGRLTSAWNWCSTIEKKPYFHVFLLSGFVGFDGEF